MQMFCWQYHSSSLLFHFSPMGGLGINHSRPHDTLCTPHQCVSLPLRPSPLSPLILLLALCPSSPCVLCIKLCYQCHPDCPLSLPNATKVPHSNTCSPHHRCHPQCLRSSGLCLLETVYSFIGPFCTFLIIPFGLDPFPLSPYSLVAYMYIPSVPSPG